MTDRKSTSLFLLLGRIAHGNCIIVSIGLASEGASAVVPQSGFVVSAGGTLRWLWFEEGRAIPRI